MNARKCLRRTTRRGRQAYAAAMSRNALDTAGGEGIEANAGNGASSTLT
jgi:hypothetical protein